MASKSNVQSAVQWLDNRDCNPTSRGSFEFYFLGKCAGCMAAAQAALACCIACHASPLAKVPKSHSWLNYCAISCFLSLLTISDCVNFTLYILLYIHILKIYLCVYVCDVCQCGHVCTITYMWRSRPYLGWGLFFAALCFVHHASWPMSVC